MGFSVICNMHCEPGEVVDITFVDVVSEPFVQESVLVLVDDVYALKSPSGHTAHSGLVVIVPAAFVYLPGGHLV